MSQFKRKDDSGFQASDRPSAGENADATGLDFSALEPQSGFSVEDLDSGQAISKAAREAESILPEAGSSAQQEESPIAAPSRAQPEKETPAKKRYYSPNEVMRKKGCIGCGGMVLAVPFLITAIGILIAIL